MRYYLIAGEASGDLHGSNLIKGLLSEDKEAQFRFWGGSLMLSASGTRDSLVQDYAAGAVMGLNEVLRKAGTLLNNIKRCKSDILAWKPDVVILIDYPGFNMKIAKFCHSKGIKVFYYIAPKTWASRSGRNRQLKKWVDKLFIVFPFEIPYFTEVGVPYIYKGNPLIDAVDNHEYIRPIEGKYIAILAGSRKAEINRMMPICVESIKRLQTLAQYKDYNFIIAGAPARSEEDYLPYIQGLNRVNVLFGRTYDILKFADAAVINSGTASLEAALIGTPQVVAWSTSRLTFFAAKYILRVLHKIKYISLGNLCIDKLAFKELIQDDFTTNNICSELRQIVENEPYRQAMFSDYAAIRSSLGEKGASQQVAQAMIEELSK